MFPLHERRQDIAKFLARTEIFKKVLNVHGSIVECGVHEGAGVMTWAHLSSIFEPVNHTRRVIGFDTFEGFPGLSESDGNPESEHAKPGGMAADSQAAIIDASLAHDADRPIGHIPKVELVKGDATVTIPQYVMNNPHLVVSLLHLDFDIYEPTKTAIHHFGPLMPRGAVIAFDELDSRDWPGETVALRDTLRINGLRLERFPFTSTLSYAVL